MPDDTYTAAVREALASGKKNDPILETIQVEHADLTEPLWLIKNNEDLTLTLEDDTEQLFEAVGFQLKLPDTGSKGLQELIVQIDNVNKRARDFVREAKAAGGPIKVYYRVYLASDLTAPQNDPPMKLTLVDISVKELRISAKAKFANTLSTAFPKRVYTREQFAGINP